MIINLHQLKKLPVVTKSGIKLGKIVDINFLVDTQSVFQYIVRPAFFSGRTFFIHVNQVLEIGNKVVVDDSVINEKNKSEDNIDRYIDNKILGGVATTEVNRE